MSFRVRQNHQRLFPKAVVTNTETNQTQNQDGVDEHGMIDEIVFFVDEETGEIKEETTKVKAIVTDKPKMSTRNQPLVKPTTAPTVVHHKMRAVSQESFM